MNISPDVNLLRSLRGERIDYGVLIGEGVDNAFDADATSINIFFSDEEIEFRDNGRGITQDHIEKLFSLGAHGPMPTTRLGRFGIGIKTHAVRVGDILSVDSTSVDGRVRAHCDWRQVLKSRAWEAPDPRWSPVAVGSLTETRITIASLRPGAPKFSLDKCFDDLAMRFYPAIAEGRQIIVNGMAVPLLSDPPMTDIVEQELVLSEGRAARVRAGLLVNVPSRLNRVHVSYEHRVIMPAQPFGCDEYSGLMKMFARVQLLGKNWHLARFKDDLADEGEREELEEAVLEVLRPILEKCTKASMFQRVDEISQLINDMVPEEFAASRPKRKRAPKEQPPSKPKSPHGIVDPAASTPNGPAKAKRPPHDRLLITFDGNDKDHGIGEFQPGRPHRVDLSPDNPLIKRLVSHRDMELGARSLYAIAIALFVQGRQWHTPRPELPFVPFGKQVSELLAIQEQEHAA